MFRSEEDLVYGFNCFGAAVLLTESRALADGELTTHEHFGVQTDNPKELMFRTRTGYARYFNSKYGRSGRLGEKVYFCSEIEGVRRTIAFLSYINRQGRHHGLSETPFGYPHCSANVIFQKELGRSPTTNLMPEKFRSGFLPESTAADRVPSDYRMAGNGLLLREDIIDTAYVEEVFVGPRNFLYYMNRLSGSDWDAEQSQEDSPCPIVTLESMEPWCSAQERQQLYTIEKGHADYSMMSDLELCGLIDKEYIPRFYPGAASPYDLNQKQRCDLGNRIYRDFREMNRQRRAGEIIKRITEQQLRRCLVIK